MTACCRLRIDRVSTPAAIPGPDPEFTWELEEDGQSACAVEVDLLPVNDVPQPVWRSGRLPRRIGEEVRYAGAPLASRQDYRWRVCAWDEAGRQGPWSGWAAFGTAIIAPDRWSGIWIGGGGALRKPITVATGLMRARLAITGLGYYEIHCNGRKASPAALAPSFTEFDQRVEYEIIDLLPYLRPGANMLGILLADGWWRHGRPGHALQVIAEIELTYADGRREIIASDGSWQAAAGPFAAAGPALQQIFDGVTLDLGWLAGGWCDPIATTAGWTPATAIAVAGRRLVPTLVPPVRQTAELRPRTVERLADGSLRADFGQNCTGWARCRVQGPAGAQVVVRHAELRRPDGTLNPGTLRTAQQTDTIALAGGAEAETVEPRMLYHGFRHADFASAGGTIEAGSLVASVVHSDVEGVAEIATSDQRIDWLLSALRWTVRSNCMSLMTDVCQRDERRGWLMDGLTGFKAGLLFYDLDALGRKWLEDMIDNQQDDGSLRSDCVPMWPAVRSVGWQRAIVLLPMILYRIYGDLAALRRAYPHMRRYADHLAASLVDGLLPAGYSRHPPEWLAIGARHDRLADNAIAADALREVAAAADILGKAGAADLGGIADRIAAAAHRAWYHAPSGFYGGCEDMAQSSQVYALRYGVTPPGERQRVVDRLVDEITSSHGPGPFVTTGIGSTEHLPMVLSDAGRDDVVWRWLQRDEYPGYGFMQRHGATAIWERWEHRTCNQMNAHNHTGFTGIATWLRERLVGIRPEPGPVPVFHLRPGVHLPLERLQATWRSRWGAVKVGWEPHALGRRLRIAIPPGCCGSLRLAGQQGEVMLAAGECELMVPAASA